MGDLCAAYSVRYTYYVLEWPQGRPIFYFETVVSLGWYVCRHAPAHTYILTVNGWLASLTFGALSRLVPIQICVVNVKLWYFHEGC
jgi:hypothetical protein